MCLTRLFITVLQQPLFSNATYTINEGESLKITCTSRNVPDITTLQILNPNGVPVHEILGVFSVPNVTRSYAGTYTCVVTSALDNSTMNATSIVIVDGKLSFCSICTIWHINRPEPNVLFILPIILQNLPYYSPQHTDYSLSKTYYSH